MFIFNYQYINWKSSFGQGKELVLATCSSIGNPHANIVISLGFISKNQLLVADCQMKKTMKNLQSNKNICLIGGYFRLFGKVKIYKTGKYFDLSVKKISNMKFHARSLSLLKAHMIWIRVKL